MQADKHHKLDSVDTGSTARIDRRQTVLAQIEAALLADKLAVLELKEENPGADPYNRAHRVAGFGNARRR
jgi:hypothetical protein